MSPDPVMIARFGATELNFLVNYYGVHLPLGKRNISSYIKGEVPAWWWEPRLVSNLAFYSGFFPPNIGQAEKFGDLMIEDMREVDLLGSWLVGERYFTPNLENAKRIVLEDMEPFFTSRPWTRVLEGKRVLVVHPFSDSIKAQYKKRRLLFPDGLLPDFELETIRAVQSLVGETPPFVDWFAALDHMKREIETRSFDVCIIGCGAYGFPLAAHVKRLGKKAIHLAGATQMLFGIIGNRWTWNNHITYPYANLFNEHWIRPNESERPKAAHAVEGACYW